MDILIPALAVAAIGLFFGALLAVAAVIFKVPTDEKVEKIEAVLPGANCGGCGFSGCAAAARAIAEGKAPTSACPVGGAKAAKEIGSILGVKSDFVPKRAVVRCSGTHDITKTLYDYDGTMDCRTAQGLFGGPKGCNYGCIGFGSCVNACKFDAIHVVNGVAAVDDEKCTACGACVRACPKNLIALIPKKNNVVVHCCSHDKGPVVKNLCEVGCLGCKICEKNCAYDAIHVIDNCAVIDYEKCVNCGTCVEKCPKKKIITFENK